MRHCAITLALAIGLSLCGEAVARPAPAYKYLHTKHAKRYTRAGPFLDWGTRLLGARKTKGFRFDKHGIPKRHIPGGARDERSRQLGGPDEYFYNPVGIAQNGLEHYSYYVIQRKKKELKQAIQMGNWLVHHQDARGAWEYGFYIGQSLKPPWISGIAQGQVISLLTRLYHKTKRAVYLRSARKALGPLLVPLEFGGLKSQYFPGHPFYEEFPRQPPGMVLNGFILTLLGIYDLAPRSGAAAEAYRQGRDSLRALLPMWDTPGGTAYDLTYKTNRNAKPSLAGCSYVRLHVILLDAMNTIDPQGVYRFYRNKWYRQKCGNVPQR
jgi:hypothetical protein